MKRSELDHVLRAAGAITLHREFVIIGSQAILGEHPDAPPELLVSREVDIFPRDAPDDSVLIDGAIGEGSVFHKTFGYYAHGVGSRTAVLPADWERRLIRVGGTNAGDSIGWCLETHDLAASKLAAGREQDLRYVRALFKHRMVDRRTLDQRIDTLDLDAAALDLCRLRAESVSSG